ncbi:hypothetical protein G6F65_014866 [Rhizopus arrhizus]|nr:hypothetical protein G6F65_014866 [Rhizopus arrhizus]
MACIAASNGLPPLLCASLMTLRRSRPNPFLALAWSSGDMIDVMKPFIWVAAWAAPPADLRVASSAAPMVAAAALPCSFSAWNDVPSTGITLAMSFIPSPTWRLLTTRTSSADCMLAGSMSNDCCRPTAALETSSIPVPVTVAVRPMARRLVCADCASMPASTSSRMARCRSFAFWLVLPVSARIVLPSALTWPLSRPAALPICGFWRAKLEAFSTGLASWVTALPSRVRDSLKEVPSFLRLRRLAVLAFSTRSRPVCTLRRRSPSLESLANSWRSPATFCLSFTSEGFALLMERCLRSSLSSSLPIFFSPSSVEDSADFSEPEIEPPIVIVVV